MGKNKSRNKKQFNDIEKQATIQGGLTAKNSLETALRLSDWDCMNYNQSLSSGNGYNNISIELLSLQRLLLTYLYKTYGILAKIVDIPVDDAYKRGGFTLSAETIDEDDLEKLEKELNKNQDIKAIKQAQKWARLFGGAALIAVDSVDGKLDKPLNVDRLQGRDLKFMPVDRWQLSYSKTNVNIPGGTWQLVNYNNTGGESAKIVDPSRIFIIQGKDSPYIVNMMVQGWGISVYEQIFQDMSQFFKSRNVLFELLDEAKTDVLKLNTMQTALSSAGGERALQKMVDMIARNKNYKSQITLSTADEYEQKQISFSGIADILKEIRIMMAGSANIPVNKLWGEGITGFGSGEDSLENYNSQIENEVRTVADPIIEWVLQLRCYQLFGRELPDLEKEWCSLRTMSAVDEQNVKDKKLNTTLQLFDRNLLTPQEVMEYLKKQDIFIHSTKALNGELEDLPLEGE